jgi:hypothetical protein
MEFMTLEARKIRFIQQFLKIENEVVIKQLEKLLSDGPSLVDEASVKPMTLQELKRRIAQSEADIAAGRHVSSSELLAKYEAS